MIMFEYEFELPAKKEYLKSRIRNVIDKYAAEFDIPIMTKDVDVYIIKLNSEIALNDFKNEMDKLLLD